MAAKPLTGRKFLIIILSFFGVMIAANLTLIYSAIRTFPGLEIKNTYDASQTFDKERRAQARLGWKLETAFDGTSVSLKIRDRQGRSPALQSLIATVGRATFDRADVILDFAQTQSPYLAPISLLKGKWELRIKAIAADGTPFRQRLPIWVD
ncbi:MAG: FixH family protein [Alphaproteobacteria bacterium]|nr:FixH family protein [Alphaproteobacteria bacterium]